MVCSTYFKNSKNSISSFFHSCDVLVISKQINAKLKLDNALIIKLKEANQNNFLDVIASVHKNLKEIKDFIIAKKN